MYHTVKTLHGQGKSQRAIARELGINRRTVKKILEALASGHAIPTEVVKPRKLDDYREAIQERMGYQSAQLIYEWLEEEGVRVSYTTVSRYVRSLRGVGEVYIPVHSGPGEEAQVDFGYLGRFDLRGRSVKVWCFSMVLSYSRLSYHELVLDQRVGTFINCHIHAFECFGGTPQSVKIDNLKSGVIEANFYEPLIQGEYAAFLSHYGSVCKTARPGRGQDKGKVESGVKYVKGNFVPRLRNRDYPQAQQSLRRWQEEVCNVRIHGTTRKVPQAVYQQEEKGHMLPLPAQRYEWYQLSERKVNRMGHIAYESNYYSVPHHLSAQTVLVKSNGHIVRVYAGTDQVALHVLCGDKGRYLTQEAHKPPYKRSRSQAHFAEKMAAIGPDALAFFQALMAHRPRHWYDLVRGVVSLQKRYENWQINAACRRALSYEALSYREVRDILQKKLYQQAPLPASPAGLGGFGHPLSLYDQLG